MYNGILFSHKKERHPATPTTYMDLEDIIFSEINQTEKKEYCMISLIVEYKNNKVIKSQYNDCYQRI